MDIYESKRDYFENVVTLTYEGKMKPHIVKQHMKKNYNCEHFEIISDRKETTFRGMTNPAMCDVKILRFFNRWDDCESDLKTGFVKIEGCDNATGFERICKESELQKVGKNIFAEHPGEDGYYKFTKFLWVKYPDNRPEQRLDDVVPYD